MNGTTKAFLMAPFFGAGPGLLLWIGLYLFDAHSASNVISGIPMLLMIILSSLGLAYAIAWILGLPLYLLLKHRIVWTRWKCIGFAGCLGYFGTFLIWWLALGAQVQRLVDGEAWLNLGTPGAVCGIIAGFPFWHFLKRDI